MPELQSVANIDWQRFTSHDFTPSPKRWTDQVLYFLMVDRFSDGREGERALFQSEDANNAIQTEEAAARWRAAGDMFCGGNLRGVISKLDYLQHLGVTTIWLSPIFKQPSFDTTMYHGYGIQDFLAVDPHFGTSEDLVELAHQLHQRGMYLIVDVVLNHAGNVFQYDYPTESDIEPPFNPNSRYQIKSFREEGVIPLELQTPETFSRRGCISEWEQPNQYLNGDFKTLKDIHLGEGWLDDFRPSAALEVVTQCYLYWLALADIDGFRIDAVKHMPPGASRYFCDQTKQFASSLGKTNFALFGEIPDGQQKAHQTLSESGMTASLAILDIPDLIENVAKGRANPEEYFSYFLDTTGLPLRPDSWKSNQLVNQLDDHDQIRKGYHKCRFAGEHADSAKQLPAALALLTLTAGVPAIYYGTEQGFDGRGKDDNYIRECMFGGEFGAFRSRDKHFFNSEFQIYQQLKHLLELRRSHTALRNGIQQLLEISGDGEHFGYPRMIGGQLKGLIPWLRVNESERVLCIINTNPNEASTAWIRLSPFKEPIKVTVPAGQWSVKNI